jgi:hypothetical protein
MYLPVVSTMLAIAFNGHAPAPKEYSLLNLRANQSLSIRYESVGCFHHFTYRFEFSEDHVVLYDLGLGKAGENPEKLGPFKLKDDDLIKLDRLFVFYAEEPAEGCTTVDTIKFTEREGTRTLRSTTYVDASCGTSRRKGILSLHDLATRLLKERN